MSNSLTRIAISRTNLASLVVAALLVVGPISAQDKAVLQGVVADQITGALLDSATVTLVGRGIRATTSSGGLFALPDAPVGLISIRTEAPGYPPVTEQIEIEPGILILQITLISTHAILDGFLVTASRTAPPPARNDPRTAADLLMDQIPGVAAKKGVVGQNDSEVLLRGVNSINLSSEPALFIDGVRTSNAVRGRASVGPQ